MGEMASENRSAPVSSRRGGIQQTEREKEDEREGRKGGKEKF